MDKEIERLINEYGNDVLRISYIYLKDKYLAEDAFQEVFVKVYKNLCKFRGNSTEKTWILSITMNTCKDILRSSWFKRVILHEDMKLINYDFDKKSDTPDTEVIKKLQYKELLKEVMDLPKKYKDVVILFYYEELSTTEISRILNIPDGTVRSRLFRAREVLKLNLDGKINYE
ncbi:sigma-70 family RNA polymerase sigma factor [Clostridium thailandense]|uniref:Sigma-70 family RNA polymerase sigma factor n=1 Tax=Clostridium thailandense TaxID=2794346 RepID=A0A949TUD6_9CLOT|nr:sigma-70 family RNA polymerase sigma factor [Clostridium thailandense]MBV7273626.1 sigma-70 family RNA polymerase sigma factor [Clostridium thailandense]MCH5136300.1 sigma-70 family RNA polymerase sigma factor [Clostridiaceae bacterium UIB06]